MNQTYKSDLLAVLHETVSDLHDARLIDKQAMRHFDERCLAPIPDLSAEQIKAIRLKSQVSQSVFAHYLNVSRGMVRQW